MSDQKMSQLPAATTPVGAEIAVIQGGANKRLPVSALQGEEIGTPGTVPLYQDDHSLRGAPSTDVQYLALLGRRLRCQDIRPNFPTVNLVFPENMEGDPDMDIMLPPTGGTLATTSQLRAIASQAQAEAGTDNTTVMTPLRAAQAIAALGGGSSPTIASQAQAQAGTDNETTMTPLRVAQARKLLHRVLVADTNALTGGDWWIAMNPTNNFRVIKRVRICAPGPLTVADQLAANAALFFYARNMATGIWEVADSTAVVSAGDPVTGMDSGEVSLMWTAGQRLALQIDLLDVPYSAEHTAYGLEIEIEFCQL